MVAARFPRGFEKSDWPTPIQTSYFIGPYYITAVARWLLRLENTFDFAGGRGGGGGVLTSLF